MLIVRKYIFFIFLLFFPANIFAGSLVVSSDDSNIMLGKHLHYLEDAKGELSLNDFLKPKYQDLLTPSKVLTPNFGSTNSVYWYTIDLKTDEDQQKLILQIDYPLLDLVDIYFIKDNQIIRDEHLGDRKVFDVRPINHRNFLLDLNLDYRNSQKIVFRVKTTSTHKFGISLHEPVAFWQQDAKEIMVQGMFFGVMVVMIFYNIFIYITLRNTAYLFYIISVLGFVFVQLALSGFGQQYVWPDRTLWNEYVLLLGAFIAVLGFDSFTNLFLDLRNRLPVFSKLIEIHGAGSALLCISTFFISYSISIKLIALATMSTVIICITSAVVRLRRGSPEAGYYLFAFTALMFGASLFALQVVGILPSIFLTNYGLQIGEGLGVILLSLALARQMKRLQEENVQIQKEAADNLQQKVDERTRELSAKNFEAERSKEDSDRLRINAEDAKLKSDLAHKEADELRHKAEEQAKQLAYMDSQKTSFFQNISHELRTPLTLILNPLENASNEYKNDQNIQIATKNAKRLLRLVNQLLDFQKLEAGKKELQLSPLNMTHFIRVCGDYFASACQSKNIDFLVTQNHQVLDIVSQPIWVMGEIDAMEKIIFNYLSNALKYTPEHGKIELALDVSEGNVRLQVTDSGAGITSEDQDKLFQVFSQVDGSTTRSYEGTGLGLALVKSLTEEMLGNVGVDSKMGEGSTFWAEFELMGEAKPFARVLLVEDDRVLRETIIDALLDNLDLDDDEIYAKSNVDEALVFLKEYQVGCVISDYNLSGKNGLDLMEEVQKVSPKAYRVLMTGDMSFDLLERGSNDQLVDQFLHKNGDPEVFIPKLEEAVSNHTEAYSESNQPIKPVLDILIVEDDIVFQKSLLEFFTGTLDLDFEKLNFVTNLEDAYACLKMNSVRCVLADYNLGVGNGLDLLEYVNNNHSDTNKVLMTAEANLAVMERAINAGAIDRVFYKPLDFEDLAECLLNFIQKSQIAETTALEENFEIKSWVLTEEVENSAEGLDGGNPDNYNHQGELILVVDDLADMRQMIIQALKKRNYRVAEAANGLKAIELARKLLPDLVVTDWMMPEMSGPDLIQAMAKDVHLASTPTILLTAKTDEESRVLGATIGATAFLGKPFSEIELLSQVGNLVNLRRQEHLAAHKEEADL
ncbi:MAG: hypothetical protein CMP10_08690, partial [Zetaproteobacteria bacterium]|nr:hypothetical protein [Pseudobdellovibrionaceae bacterium]